MTGKFPQNFNLTLKKVQDCRYGENPQQDGVVYKLEDMCGMNMFIDETLLDVRQHQGKTMSFNNYLDADAALKMVREFDGENCCAVFKHANPSGVAVHKNPHEAYRRAWNCDPLSAFGGIIGTNFPVGSKLAEEMITDKFFEAILAPGYSPEALEVFNEKPKIRVLELDMSRPERTEYDFRQITGVFLVQEVDRTRVTPEMLTYPNELVPDLEHEIKKPMNNQIGDMIFGWYVNRNTKSNTVLLVKDKATVGIGAGQQNRVDSAFIACWRGNKDYNKDMNLNDALEIIDDMNYLENSLSKDIPSEMKSQLEKRMRDNISQIVNLNPRGRVQNSVAVSSAFYPFPDTLWVLSAFGVEASLSPSGSIRDKLSYEAMHKLGMAAAHTDLIPEDGKEGYKGGRRAFKH